ncbi:hypothetical protein EZJ19_11725 [Parasulfuritortus cantonensis]|uniref:Damage-inducible protein DinB n=1 Tax=Parasulfuritortus cantonensis TaxID=2528202 RepID=A0A4R1B475_9PROT|nr:DinB family protein [Parasulfuritortus cantonensis]TCJ12894.1 hypothetical protein EZJ19_11725 [Parasulfuritortus cantonensis]
MYTWKSFFVVQADYQHWANEALFASLARLRPEILDADEGPALPSIHHDIEHMLAVGQLWFARLQDADAAALREAHHPIWRELLNAVRLETRRLEKWLEAQPDAFFDAEVSFTDADGRARVMWVRDVLNHLYTEFARLRGQIGAAAARLGAPRAELDYASYRREMVKLLQEARQAPR